MDYIREAFSVHTKSASHHSERSSSHVKRTECNVPADELSTYIELIEPSTVESLEIHDDAGVTQRYPKVICTAIIIAVIRKHDRETDFL
jgi:hypothetical protein